MNSSCDLNKGHRQRLKQRIVNAGFNALADYELLEMLLFFVNSRKDTKNIAKNLLKRFESLKQVIKAQKSEILKVDSVGEQTVLLFGIIDELLVRLSKQEIINKAVFKNWMDVLQYLNNVQGFSDKENLRLLFLNSQNELIHEELSQTGCINEVAIFSKQIVKRAIEIGASGVIMTHNHTSSNILPSQNDITNTNLVKQALNLLNIELIDHLIISKNGFYSFKNNNAL